MDNKIGRILSHIADIAMGVAGGLLASVVIALALFVALSVLGWLLGN